MKATDFIEIWQTFAVEKLDSLYKSKNELTHAILGEPKRQNTGSPLGDFLQSTFPSYEYYTEDGKVDIAFSTVKKFSGIFPCTKKMNIQLRMLIL